MKIKKWLNCEPCIAHEFDSVDVRVVPDLELSPVEIMQRFKRGEPLDLLRRNGTFAVEDTELDMLPDDYGKLSEYEGVDLERLDLVEQQEVIEESEKVLNNAAKQAKAVQAAKQAKAKQ